MSDKKNDKPDKEQLGEEPKTSTQKELSTVMSVEDRAKRDVEADKRQKEASKDIHPTSGDPAKPQVHTTGWQPLPSREDMPQPPDAKPYTPPPGEPSTPQEAAPRPKDYFPPKKEGEGTTVVTSGTTTERAPKKD